MNKITRRRFLSTGALGIGSAVIASQFPLNMNASVPPKAVNMKIGFQSWVVKDMLVKDFPGTLKKIADLGYESIEMCSPRGYENSGFAPLINLSAKEMKKIINDAGLELESTHYVMGELRDNLDERIEFALESGQKQMILSSFWLPEKATMSDWMKSADELNNFGVKAKQAGIQMGFHNHHMEFAKIDGKLIYDALLDQFDPDYIKMQFQVAVINIGYKAADYFKKHPGRFISAHLADYSPADNKKSIATGQGIVDWKEFFDTVKTGGLKNIFVEMDFETFRDSAIYLRNL
jgi:sugar phosphate isomerase/epimerase